MHSAFLNVDHEKMSKSLGNFFTTRDVLDKLDAVQGGEQLRYFLLRGHYRSEVSYTWETLEDAGNALRGFYTTLREVPPAPTPRSTGTSPTPRASGPRWTTTSTRRSPSPCCTSCAAR